MNMRIECQGDRAQECRFPYCYYTSCTMWRKLFCQRSKKTCISIIMSISNIWQVENVPVSMSTHLCKHESHKVFPIACRHCSALCATPKSLGGGHGRRSLSPQPSSPHRWTPVGLKCSREGGGEGGGLTHIGVELLTSHRVGKREAQEGS